MLTSLIRNFEISSFGVSNPSILDLREQLERFLFQKAITENKTVVLIIDEAQKLSESSLELLRILLNYETNEFKLLQLILLGQLEFYSKMYNIANFFDRISFKYTLNPLMFQEAKDLIEFRIRQAGYRSHIRLFLDEAVKEIYEYSRGYPRQITMLCHKALKSLIIRNSAVVDGAMVHAIIEEEGRLGWQKRNAQMHKAIIKTA